MVMNSCHAIKASKHVTNIENNMLLDEPIYLGSCHYQGGVQSSYEETCLIHKD